MRHPSALAIFASFMLVLAGCGKKDDSARALTEGPATSTSTRRPPPRPPVSALFEGAQKARLDGEFAAVVLADGRKKVVPMDSLSPGDLAFLTELAEQKPLVAAGKSSLVVVATTDVSAPKKTIQVSTTDGPLETVQLCPPNVARDQIGGTCMLYARVHWLDIAGFYTDLPAIFEIINDTPPDHPWTAPKYVKGLESIMTGFKTKPVCHKVPPGADQFTWARDELRRGRPLLAALPREIWQALPADFLAQRPWNGGSVGHQIVVNGFTWNRETNQGSFHVVNSWSELPEFDLETKWASDGALVFEASLSPIGETPTREELAAANEVVQSVRFLKPVGSANLYEVTTTVGVRKIIAPDPGSARRMVEEH